MKLLTFQKRNSLLPIISGLLIFIFSFAPISSQLEIKKAEAIWPTFDAANVVQTTSTAISSGATAGTSAVSATANTATAGTSAIDAAASTLQAGLMTALHIKELSLDAVAWALVNIALQQMIRSVTQWVASGFQGSPAFLTDMQGFLTNIADHVAGDIIYGSGLSLICSPFKLNVQLALSLQYKKTRGGYNSQCTLSGVVRNIDRFLNGDILAGGWPGFHQMVMRPQNNPYGQMAEASAAISVGIVNSQGQKLDFIKMGSGFKNKEKCVSVETEEDPETGLKNIQEKCTNATPGKVIEGQLNSSLAGGQRRLEVADEINELIGALFGQLVSAALGGVGGLLGMGSSNGDAAGSYFDQAARQATPTTNNIAGASNSYTSLLANEQTYRTQQLAASSTINAAATYVREYRDTHSCSADPALSSTLLGYKTTIEEEVAKAERSITALTSFRDDTAVLSSATPASTALIDKYIEPLSESTNANALAKLKVKFLELQGSGSLHTEAMTTLFRVSTVPMINTAITTYKSDYVVACGGTVSGGATYTNPAAAEPTPQELYDAQVAAQRAWTENRNTAYTTCMQFGGNYNQCMNGANSSMGPMPRITLANPSLSNPNSDSTAEVDCSLFANRNKPECK